ncbi:MAG: IPT/TIG domain-containing protein [bacterium]
MLNRLSLLLLLCLAGTFARAAAPTITDFTPSGGVVGTVVTITGTDLDKVTSVTFNGIAAKTITDNTATELKVTVPEGATSGRLIITTAGGTVTNSYDFAVLFGVKTNSAADKIRWMCSITSLDGSVVVRFNPDIDNNIGFFQSDGKLRRIVRAQHSIETLRMSSDGYLGVVGEERREDGMSGKVFYLYCPLGHFVWKSDLGKMLPMVSNYAIAENGNAVAVYSPVPGALRQPEVLKIFDADGKEVRSTTTRKEAKYLNFIDSTILLQVDSQSFSALNVTTGVQIWKNDKEGFEYGYWQMMTLSSDKSVFMFIDLLITKTDTGYTLAPRMRVFKTTTGELLIGKSFEKRSPDKWVDRFHIRYDAEKHQFSVDEVPEMMIQY